MPRVKPAVVSSPSAQLPSGALPAGCEEEYDALIETDLEKVKDMLKEVALPLTGSKQEMVLRLLCEVVPKRKRKDTGEAGSEQVRAKKGKSQDTGSAARKVSKRQTGKSSSHRETIKPGMKCDGGIDAPCAPEAAPERKNEAKPLVEESTQPEANNGTAHAACNQTSGAPAPVQANAKSPSKEQAKMKPTSKTQTKEKAGATTRANTKATKNKLQATLGVTVTDDRTTATDVTSSAVAVPAPVQPSVKADEAPTAVTESAPLQQSLGLDNVQLTSDGQEVAEASMPQPDSKRRRTNDVQKQKESEANPEPNPDQVDQDVEDLFNSLLTDSVDTQQSTESKPQVSAKVNERKTGAQTQPKEAALDAEAQKEDSELEAEDVELEAEDVELEEAVQLDAQETEAGIRALILDLEPGVAECFNSESGKWLRHLERVLEAEVEAFAIDESTGVALLPGVNDKAENTPEDQDQPPRKLHVSSPNGQSESTGAYRLLQEESANGQPLWQKENSERWLYSGTDKTWLVCGPKQKSLNFACRTGVLHLARLHGGKPPNRMPAGGWKRVDGKQWVADPEISVSNSTPRPGMPVTVCGMQEQPGPNFNGQVGYIASKQQVEGSDSWQAQLADKGKVDIPEDNLEFRQVKSGEVWVRPKSASFNSCKATCLASVSALGAVLTGSLLKPEIHFEAVGDSLGQAVPDDSLGITTLEVPTSAALLPGKDLQRLMESHEVVMAVLESDCDAGDAAPEGEATQQLAIFGKKKHRAGALLSVLKLVEELKPGQLQSPTQGSTEEVAGALGNLGFSVESMHPGCEESAARKLLPQVAASSDVLIAAVKRTVLIVGDELKRRQAIHLLTLGQNSVEGCVDVPPELATIAAFARVPGAAREPVKMQLPTLENELDVFFVWCHDEQQEAQTTAPTAEERLNQVKALPPGTLVLAQYEGTWCPGKLEELDAFEGTARVRWDYDSSTSDIALELVKPKPTAEEKRKRLRQQKHLDSAERLAIFGAAQQRKTAAVKIMATVEESCPGLWTSELEETADELRGRVGEETSVDIQVCSVTGKGALPAAQTLKASLKTAADRAARAAGIHMQLLHKKILILVGRREERELALEYLAWIADEKARTNKNKETSTISSQGSVVRCKDIDGDQLLFQVNSKGKLDFYVDGVQKLLSISSLTRKSALTLQMSGSSPGATGSTVRCAELATGKESEAALQTILTLFESFKVTASVEAAAGARGREDIRIVEATHAQAVWIEPMMLLEIEYRTRTLALNVDDLGSEDDWNPDARCNIYVCSPHEAARKIAAEQVQKILDTLARSKDKVAESTDSTVSKAPNAQTDKPAEKKAIAQVPAPQPKVEPKAQSRSNPLEELRALRGWPKDNAAWKDLQDVIWRGHPRLGAGWIRVWSRSKDSEYYVRVKDGKATFDFREASK